MDLAIEVVRDAVGRSPSGADGEACLRAAFGAAHARCTALEEEHRAAFEVELRRYGTDRLGASLAACRTVAARCGRPVESFAHFAASITAIHCWGNDQITVAQVGACRAYRLRRRILEQVLPDHTLASAAAASGEKLDPELVASFHLIPTRLLGMPHGSDVDVRTEHVEAGDRYLLCTDGLWSQLGVRELEAALGGDAAPAVVAAGLVDLVAQRPPPRPHVTTVIIDVVDGTHGG